MFQKNLRIGSDRDLQASYFINFILLYRPEQAVKHYRHTENSCFNIVECNIDTDVQYYTVRYYATK